MKKYMTPDIDIIKFDTVDIIQTSAGGGKFEIVDGDAGKGAELEGDVIIGA